MPEFILLAVTSLIFMHPCDKRNPKLRYIFIWFYNWLKRESHRNWDLETFDAIAPKPTTNKWRQHGRLFLRLRHSKCHLQSFRRSILPLPNGGEPLRNRWPDDGRWKTVALQLNFLRPSRVRMQVKAGVWAVCSNRAATCYLQSETTNHMSGYMRGFNANLPWRRSARPARDTSQPSEFRCEAVWGKWWKPNLSKFSLF